MDADHRTSNELSLRLTRAALASLKQHPARLKDVMATLDHWELVAPVDSRPLRERWRQLLQEQDWSLALDPGDLGQQLRQASPLGKALDPAERLSIIKSCKGRNSNT